MIAHYEFDNANLDGDKEAVVVPNPPTLVNKLSANETNGIKDKLNEVVDLVNTVGPTPFGSFRLELKGDENTLNTIQVGDRGRFYDGNTYEYTGGDTADPASYELIGSYSLPKIQFTADGTQTTFDLESLVPAKAVFWNGVALNDVDWSQASNILTLTFAPASGDIIKPI